jgi:hypothetical protein
LRAHDPEAVEIWKGWSEEDGRLIGPT